jgi:hypothetical protein
MGYFSILLSFPFSTTSSYETAAWDGKRREEERRWGVVKEKKAYVCARVCISVRRGD